jgi:hypothetical protein
LARAASSMRARSTPSSNSLMEPFEHTTYSPATAV